MEEKNVIEIPIRTEAPLSKDTVLRINQKKIQEPLDRQNIDRINRPAVAPGGGAAQGNRQNPSGPAPHSPSPAPAPAPSGAPAAPPPRMTIPPLTNPVRKGQKVPLESGGKLRSIKACMGWNVLDPRCDVDVSAFLLNNGKVMGDNWFVFYGQDVSPEGSTRFVSGAAPDRELISIDFTRLNPSVDRIALILTIHEALEQRLNFSMIQDAYIRLIDSATNRELVSFRIEEYYANVISMTIGEIYLHNGAWKFSAVGNGVGKDLAGLCQMYGVQVE